MFSKNSLIPTFVTTAIYLVLGLSRDILLAIFIGAGFTADALIVAIRLPHIILNSIFTGPFTKEEILRKYKEKMTLDKKNAAPEFAYNIFATTLIVSLALCMIAEAAMPFLPNIIAPGFTNYPSQVEDFLFLSRTIYPYLSFASTTMILCFLLRKYDRFNIESIGMIILNISLITSLTIFSSDNPAEALSIGFLVAGILQLSSLIYIARKENISIGINFVINEDIKLLCKRLAPSVIIYGTIQMGTWIDLVFASSSPSSISYIYYAERIVNIPIFILFSILSTTIFSVFYDRIVNNDLEQANYLQNRAFEFMFVSMIPITTLLVLIPDSVIHTILAHGEITVENANNIADTCSALALTIPAYIMNMILLHNLSVRGIIRAPIIIAIISLSAKIILNTVLFAKYQHVGLAYATSTAAWISTVSMLIYTKKEFFFKVDKQLSDKIIYITVATSGMLLIVTPLEGGLHNYFIGTILPLRIAALSTLIAFSLATYIGLLRLMKSYKQGEVMQLLSISSSYNHSSLTSHEPKK